MSNRKQQLEEFFTAYAARFNAALAGETPDVDGTVNSFTPCFIEAGPTGVTCGQNDAQFREAIPKGYEFYKSVGTKAMDILLTEITLLDDLHAMVKVYWRSTNVRAKDNAEVTIEFDVFYFVQTMNEEIKIFAYITGDEQKALKENGLLPG